VRFSVLNEATSSPAAPEDSVHDRASTLSAETLSATLQAAAQSSAWLFDTSTLYAVVSNETLVVTSSTAQLVVVPINTTDSNTTAPRSSDSGCSGQCMVFVLVTIVAGLGCDRRRHRRVPPHPAAHGGAEREAGCEASAYGAVTNSYRVQQCPLYQQLLPHCRRRATDAKSISLHSS
jgi:hypothetical protein